jgi:uncharacterized protein YkwD
MALATRPKPKVQHKKRNAQHHRQTRHYMKTYWPYLPMLLIVGVGLAINSTWPHGTVLGVQADFSSSTLLNDTNNQRTADHEAALTLDPLLAKAAQAKAEDMVTQNYWAHTSPSGKTPWTFITDAGYQYQSAGENLAYGFANADDTMAGWMNSPDHRANILGTNYQNVGFGVAESPDFQGHGPETIVVAEYGQPVPAVANITFSVPTTAANTPVSSVKGAQTELSAQPVSRIQILTGGNAAWSLAVVSALAGGALVLFITRHGLRLRRALVKSELFISHHPFLDIAITFIGMAGFVLSRTSGVIR